jgi:CRISPR/Cas system-associated exonuclease Cas4 (RecB family)
VRTVTLTKTMFQSGLACPKRLWWEVHEPDAQELRPDAQAQWMFRQGQEVTLAAGPRIPTARPEVTLQAQQLHARVDLLEPAANNTHILIEVKGSNEIKPEHLWDVAFQRHVAALAGVEVVRAELMHLNRACRHPGLESLFIRQDVTAETDRFQSEVPDKVEQLLAALDGPLPDDSRNATCGGCPFYNRCWPQERFSVNRFYRMKWGDKLDLEQAGATSFVEVPPAKKLSSIQLRQQVTAHTDAIVVEPTLRGALAEWKRPLVYLDFETVSFAIPRFPGTTPWTKIPVQYSVHREEGSGHQHAAFLAGDGGDPRRALAESLVAHCEGKGSVVTYHSSFEKGCLRGLAEAAPELGDELMRIHERVVDLEPTVAHHVYHPDFNGSFSLKVVLPTLCPDVTYEKLAIADGSTAQLEIARLLYGPAPLAMKEETRLRANLLAYCELDTWAMVVLHEKLWKLAELAE